MKEMNLSGHCYLVDHLHSMDLNALLKRADNYYSQIIQKHVASDEYFSIPGGDKLKIDESSVLHIPLFREEDSRKIMVLVNTNKSESVLAIYLNEIWWPVDEILKSSYHEGLKQVQTIGERLVLFVLNCLVFGILEGGASEDGVNFLAHSAGELAKIFWLKGKAVAFYTYKTKGNLCNRTNSQCYQLTVLDTMFVRKTHRRHGLGTQMLEDYCQSFRSDAALGISYPISSAMYQVCIKFLNNHPDERDRLWEVEAPGDWDQRINIWLRIQLGENPSVQECAADSKDLHPCEADAQLKVSNQDLAEGDLSFQTVSNNGQSVSLQDQKRRRNQTETKEETFIKKIKTD
ncbi:protein FAM169B isoform X2 [Bombina bombina]|uniref:protein FAM169B isoform X2 n=1 Tax=Bombina bombina TaxID=8345 RepID=UPI00235B082C|nr:protein FAM169B isoform X2 [Bombina bombina]